MLRDRVAVGLANFILRTIGTQKYRTTLKKTITTGMATLNARRPEALSERTYWMCEKCHVRGEIPHSTDVGVWTMRNAVHEQHGMASHLCRDTYGLDFVRVSMDKAALPA